MLTVGGKTDDRHGSPVELSGSVRLLSDGRYIHRGSYATGITTHMGRTAVVESSGNTIVLTENRVMPFDAQQFLSLGISPAYCQAFIVKSAVAWRAAYGEYPREVIDVDAPGICTGNLLRLGLSDGRAQMVRPRVS
jgi:microcystin degradation protein MlrC